MIDGDSRCGLGSESAGLFRWLRSPEDSYSETVPV